jgi:hypothetical protein
LTEVGTVKPAKQIVFRYNGDPTTEEIDLDMDGDKSVPELTSPSLSKVRLLNAKGNDGK